MSLPLKKSHALTCGCAQICHMDIWTYFRYMNCEKVELENVQGWRRIHWCRGAWPGETLQKHVNCELWKWLYFMLLTNVLNGYIHVSQKLLQHFGFETGYDQLWLVALRGGAEGHGECNWPGIELQIGCLQLYVVNLSSKSFRKQIFGFPARGPVPN